MENKIIDRIRKLLALASNNTNVEEAASAAAQAQELLFKHKLDVAQIEIDTGEADAEEIGSIDVDEPGARGQRWKQTVLNGLARGFFCRAIIWAGARNADGDPVARVKVVGKPSDTQTVSYLYAYVVSEIERLCDEQAKYLGRSFRNTFKLGAAHSIYDRLDEQVRAQEAREKSSETALVLFRGRKELDAYVLANIGKTRSTSGPRIKDADAYYAGRDAGDSINIHGGGRGLNGRQKLLG